MKVLVVTNMYPTETNPHFGVFVEEQVESLRRLGVDIDVLFVNGRAGKINYLAGFPRLYSRLAGAHYDLIHAHYIFAGLIARAQLACPVVLTHHGPEVFMTWEASLCRLFTRFFDKVIVVSEEMKRRLPAPNASVIPCGVDMQRFRPGDQEASRRVLGLPRDRKLVLWAGEPQRPEKRYELVEAAISRLRDRRPDVELITLTGKPHSLVPKYMNACDALVLTSDAEGSPMVVKEAMACNLPVVSTPAGDVREVIGGTAGCYVCSQDPADIAQKLAQALDHPGRTSGREAIAHLDLDAISARIVNVYEQTLAGRRAARATAQRGAG